MAGEHNGSPSLVVDPDRVPESMTGFDVQAGRRLVEQHQIRAADEGDGHCEPAFLASGQPAGLAPFEPGQAELLQQLTRWHRVVEVAGDEVDDFLDPQGRGQPGLLRGGPQSAASGGLAGVAAEELDRSGGRPAQPGEQLQQGGLPGAVGAEQPEQLPGRDVQRDAVEGDDRSVAAGCLHGSGQRLHFSLLTVRSGGSEAVLMRRCSPRRPAGPAW